MRTFDLTTPDSTLLSKEKDMLAIFIWIPAIIVLIFLARTLSNLSFHLRVRRECKIPTKSGIKVQSHGERRIADWLFENGYSFIYDKPLYGFIFGGYRPDFRIHKKSEPDIIIEYWGRMHDPKYCMKREKKERYYAENGYRLISIIPEQKIEGLLWLHLGKVKPKNDKSQFVPNLCQPAIENDSSQSK